MGKKVPREEPSRSKNRLGRWLSALREEQHTLRQENEAINKSGATVPQPGPSRPAPSRATNTARDATGSKISPPALRRISGEQPLNSDSTSWLEVETRQNDSEPIPATVVEQVPPPRTIEVAVGLPPVIFHINREAASATSRFFRAVSTREDELSLSSSPPLSNCSPGVLLPNQDPAVFRMYEEWLTVQPQPGPLLFRPGECSAEPWFSLAAQACVLGSRLRAMDFERYALSQLIQNCAAMPFGPWESIENLPEWHRPRAMERFANHWVAWNCSLIAHSDGTLPPGSEYTGLRAAALAVQVVKHVTADPRLVDLDHWYNACSENVAPVCLHIPHVRLRTEEETLAAVARLKRDIEWEERATSESYLYESKLQAGSDKSDTGSGETQES